MIINRALELANALSVVGQSAPVNTLHIGLFRGAVPDLNLLFETTAAQSNTPVTSWTAAATTLGLAQSNFLGVFVPGAVTPIYNSAARTLTLPFSGSAANMTALITDKPTFFVLRQVPAAQTNSWAGFATGAIPTSIIIGTVGAEGSDAELQFSGNGTMTTGQVYRFLDLTFQL